MLIAQLSVAGEVHTRLENPDRSGQPDDQQALTEYACDRSNLPWVIFRAAHRANHIAALPARARSLLAALARTVDSARPFAAIFARRELLTGRALQSMRTFYRSLDDLEKAGLITRPPQTRYNAAGLFGRAYLHLTQDAASLLGLVDHTTRPPKVDAVPNQLEHESDQAPIVSLAIRSATLADGAIYKDLYPTNQKRQPGRLPADLRRLCDLGFRDFLIFKLMREARESGKRLSDVVEATWENLKRARHPINYLRKLLASPIDFAFRVSEIRKESVKAAVEKARAVDTQASAEEIAGRVFTSSDGLREYVVADDATYVTLHQRGENQPRVRTGAWISDFLGALRAGTIALATDGSHRTDRLSNRVAAVHDHHRAETARQRLADIKRLLASPSTSSPARRSQSRRSSASTLPPDEAVSGENRSEHHQPGSESSYDSKSPKYPITQKPATP